MSLGQYNSLGEYCDPHTASSVLLILVLPTGGEGRGVLGVGSIPAAILPSSQDRKNIALHILPTGSEERGVLVVGSIPVAILPSCQDIKTIA